MTYSQLWQPKSFPKAVYIFSDYDRLSSSDRENASALRAHMVNSGCKVLNDPKNFRDRFQTLRLLHSAGINDYAVWDVGSGEEPDAFPVFLRTKAGHRGLLTQLLHNKTEAAQAVSQALDEGYTISDLMFAQFANTKVENKIYQRRSVFKIGESLFSDMTANEDTLAVKIGKRGSLSMEGYERELRIYKEKRNDEWAQKIFEFLGVEFGRLDYGYWKGKPQFYEINTNPQFKNFTFEHPSEHTVALMRIVKQQRDEAFVKLDIDIQGHFKVPYKLRSKKSVLPSIWPWKREMIRTQI